MPTRVMQCRNVRTHNLKNIDIDIPLKKWVAVTGVSGSGKSSLVFDTIFAEAQRRFLETLGTYERQFFQGLPQGEFDSLDPIQAAIALKQSNKTDNPRSLVAKTADLADPLRTLFASLMKPSCSSCGTAVQTHTPQDVVDKIENYAKQGHKRLLLTVSFRFPKELAKKKKLAQSLLAEGYIRIYEKRSLHHIEDLLQKGLSQVNNTEIVLDRLSANTERDELANRIESLWAQVRVSSIARQVHLWCVDTSETAKQSNVFMVEPWCPHEKMHTRTIQARNLDWSSALGSCKTCHGIGHIPVLDEQKIVPDPSLSLADGALKIWKDNSYRWILDTNLAIWKHNGIDITLPWKTLPREDKYFIWDNTNPKNKYTEHVEDHISVHDFFSQLESERYKTRARIMLAHYRTYQQCPGCEGTRLSEAGRNASVGGHSFHRLLSDEIQESLKFVESLQRKKEYREKLEEVRPLYREVLRKLQLLSDLGLGSLQLGRRSRTLSGGEYQRVLLSRVIGNGLTDALYILDEPSVGLGEREIPAMAKAIQDLKDLGNTVLMVEHDPALIRAADHIIELGPGGGHMGGTVLPLKKGQEPQSLILNLPKKQGRHKTVAPPIDWEHCVSLKGFNALNCKNLNLSLPLAALSTITGPSGAGKSTLVKFGLSAALNRLVEKGESRNRFEDLDAGLGTWDNFKIRGLDLAKTQCVVVEQRAMHRSITSIAATVLGLLNPLRTLFAGTPEARALGLQKGDFAFNSKGACEECRGRGVVKDDLFFLGEVERECPSCLGKRYRDAVQEPKWCGKSITQWLDLSIAEAQETLQGQGRKFEAPLRLAVQLGLGHLSLGVSTTQISGGEAQRLRLAAALSQKSQKILAILDEPTRGLSEYDIGLLLKTLLELTQEGHTFIVVEHHQAFVQRSHFVVNLGPEGGKKGGKVVSLSVSESMLQ